jgi:hypothetical protein
MEDMAVLPAITCLHLMVMANGHAFEASAFHVLRLSTGIRRLMLMLSATRSEVNLFFVCLILSPDTEKKVAFWSLKGIFDNQFQLKYVSKAKLN